MNALRHLPAAALLALWGLTASCHRRAATPPEGRTDDAVQTFVGRAQQCSRLYTTEYTLRKIVIFDDEVRLKGQIMNRTVNVKLSVGDRKVAIPITVTLKGYVDMSRLTASNVERTPRGLTITLPDPGVVLSATRVDTRGMKQVVGIARKRFTAQELEALERQGVDSVMAHLGETGIIEQTRADAARTLVPLLRQLGYEDEQITVRFAGGVTDEPWPAHIQIERRKD